MKLLIEAYGGEIHYELEEDILKTTVELAVSLMKLLILDDHIIFGESLKRLLEEWEEIESCQFVSNTLDFWKLLKKEEFDILLVDINLKEERTGFDIIQEILKENPGEKIVVLTSYDLDHYKEKAFKLGVKDYLNKSMEVEKLVESLIKVQSGKTIYKKQFLLDPLTER